MAARHALQLAGAAWAALWALDVLVNLGLPGRLARGEALHARPLDFVGLAVALAPLAVFLAAACIAAAEATHRLPGGADRRGESLALLAAALAAAAAVAILGWPPGPTTLLAALPLAAGTGAALFAGLRFGFRRRRKGGWRLGELVGWTSLPALAVGFAVSTPGTAGSARFEWAAAALAAALALLAPRLRALAWLGPLAALALAGGFCLEAGGLGRPGEAAAATAGAARPNVVLVVIDTLRADHLRRYGYARDTMPALERWAAGALVARRAISPAGWTAPAHASLFSGRPVSRHGIHSAADGEGFRTRAFEDVAWLPDALAARGYTPVAVSANPIALPDEVRGFERVVVPRRADWNGRSLGALTDRLFPPTARIGERLGWRMPYVDAAGILELAIDAGSAAGRPLFLFVNLLDAHSPYNPPAAALDALGVAPGRLVSRYHHHTRLTQLWPSLPAGKEEYVRDLYDGELRWIDMHLERFLAWIDAALGADTVVIVTSDHGEELGEAGRVGHEYGLSQALVHVPLFVRAPGLAPGELREPISLRALHGFVLGASGGGASGEALRSPGEPGVLAERYPSARNARVLGPEYRRAWVALFEDDLKVVGPTPNPFEVFALDAEGRERAANDVAPERSRVLAARIDAWWRESRDRRGEAAGAEIPDATRRALEALGYAE